MAEERLKVLEMLSEGKITPEEANDLLETIKSKKPAPASCKCRYLKIKVIEGGGKEKVNVNLPLSLAKFALKFIPESARQEMTEQGIDLDTIISSLTDDLGVGQIVSVEDGDDKVEIYVE